eukprot:COSAG01_NODE_2968_length_6788_cov_4.595904_5_plen_113_part_00
MAMVTKSSNPQYAHGQATLVDSAQMYSNSDRWLTLAVQVPRRGPCSLELAHPAELGGSGNSGQAAESRVCRRGPRWMLQDEARAVRTWTEALTEMPIIVSTQINGQQLQECI